MNVLITGISGFVGQNLQRYLTTNNLTVVGCSLRSSDWETKVLENVYTAIIHLAGKAHDTSNTADPTDYFKVNYELTKEVFETFLKSETRDFFYFSSVKAVADSVADILEENFTAVPLTPYGKSKLEAEKYLLSKHLPEGKRLFIIRPCMIHGPGNKGNLNLLYKVVEKGIPWPLASFNNKRSFLSIDNLSFLVLAMINKKEMNSGVYNFADDIAISTNELVTLIANNLGRSPRLWHIPTTLINFVAKIGDSIPFPLNSERVKKLTESYVVSNQKIKGALEIEKLPLTSKEGLVQTIRSFRSSNV
ncbi:NAD-dependent epimerase/dehydratase family protein [Sphingobacterium puteale]|uniref:NAD-dependent epimerase/dehydratase family protein n=1 Tax=Sphingobacterium puteale TaxID=2420510 RepID=A0A420VQR9_9SPHI|nr:NAD-dependent epimerase/dehydratase family protein [Sphingobacterium puteale]RKO68676.1 NAD-dependent epimerase/dehydratase family protein [Sphingobacterium puteale]